MVRIRKRKVRKPERRCEKSGAGRDGSWMASPLLAKSPVVASLWSSLEAGFDCLSLSS